MTFLRAIIAVFSATAASLIFQCANLAGGGGSEWEAKITGYAVYDGTDLPVIGARVVLCPERFLKDTSGAPGGSHAQALRETVTDEAGFFTFDSLKPGTFHIEVNDMQLQASLSECTISENDTGCAISCALKPTGRICGTFTFPAGYRGGAYVQVYGLDRVARAAPNGAFELSDLPEGDYTLHVVLSDPEYTAKDVGSVLVAPGIETRLGAFAALLSGGLWSHKRRIYLNTTETGANVGGDVTGFPVLVRLNSGNFDFSQAQAAGADIRFTKSDNTCLPYEIERWNATSRQAEIWVRVDTVRGNNATQSLIMYWGNSNAAAQSNGPAVFDTSSGFQGVWHLGETSGTRAADASRNGFSGTYRGGLPKNVTGPLGICQNIIHPDTDYVDMGDVLNPGLKNISVGIWVKRAAFGTQQALIAKTNGDAPSATYGYLLSIDLFNYPHFYLASGGANFGDDGVFDVTSNLTITDSTLWHYLFVTVDRSDNYRCRMYVDGIDRTGTMRGNVSRVADVANTLRLRVGTENDNNYSYRGAIDEATIAFTTRSADWVRLCYMNQKEQDALVKFE